MTRNQCISLLRSCADVLRQRFGIRSLCLFGSMARNEQREESDVDVCVEMPPKLFLLVELGMYLEELLGCHVDVVRRQERNRKGRHLCHTSIRNECCNRYVK